MIAALTSAVAWAAVDLLRKQLASRIRPVALAVWLNALLLPLLLVWALVARAPLPGAAYALPAMLDLVAIALAQVLYLAALDRSELSAAVPMVALTPALSALLSWAALGETPGALQAAGIAAVVVGCLANAVLASGGLVPDRGLVAMVVVAVLWSGTATVDKWALRHAHPAWHATAMVGGSALLLAAGLALGGGLRLLTIPRGWRWRTVATTVVLALAYGLQLVAFTLALVGVVEGVKRGLGTVAAAVNGRVVLGERIGVARALAVGVVAAGVAAIAAG